MYKIVRHYYGKPYHEPYHGEPGHVSASKRTIKSGLTLEQAQAHCGDPETSSSTCTSAAGRRRTRERGEWFDGYSET